MSLNETVSAERPHIAFFGKRNAGKSSLVNAITGQQLSVVSNIKGTTTDPVKKAMELLPLGPVVIIDTPGIDDEGILGELRVKKAREILAKTDIAVLVVDATVGLSEDDHALLHLFDERNLPYLIAYNKSDLLISHPTAEDNSLYLSAFSGFNVNELKNKIASFVQKNKSPKHIVADLLDPGDLVVLVTPIDESAPKGRLILPQQQTMRDILDTHCTVIACQDSELAHTLSSLTVDPKLVITDSQAFGKVSQITPSNIPLTSFSILFARYKGDLAVQVRGASTLSELKDGDPVLVSEGCTHHRQCGDIGSVKLPAWIKAFTGSTPAFHFTSGGDFPVDVSPYKLIVHCGGCMLNEAEMKDRIRRAACAGVPIVNYGIAIAHMHGILRRSLAPFPAILKLLD